MPSILFVCTANQFRSPVAAACLQERLQEAGLTSGWTVESAGTWAMEGAPMSTGVLRALRPLGINLEHHRPRPVSEELLRAFDLILVMEAGQKEALRIEFPAVLGRVFLLSEVAEGVPYDIPDPTRDPSYSFAAVAVEVRNLVRDGFLAICAKAMLLAESHRQDAKGSKGP
jgi:protein arginine phosphatase